MSPVLKLGVSGVGVLRNCFITVICPQPMLTFVDQLHSGLLNAGHLVQQAWGVPDLWSVFTTEYVLGSGVWKALC